ncbi:response regulator transcription factor [Kangiella sp. TOML190]|uniref:response regulator n=1 Tax=Kangiella sp. TOML190 TaxID=2931351 RepID=UPI00203EFEB6|nr:response regulator transcription factor [Kangiella sp. TOML190]
MNDSLSFLIADDHPLFRQALQQVLLQKFSASSVHEASNFEEVLNHYQQHRSIDLLLLDLSMPGNNGLHSVKTLLEKRPEVAVLVVSANTDLALIQQLLQLGINGYVPKSSSFEVIAEAITAVLNMQVWLPQEIAQELRSSQVSPANPNLLDQLTPQQLKVLALIADGMLNKQMAYELGVQESTIKQHVSAILKKLNLVNRTQAGIFYKQQQFDD